LNLKIFGKEPEDVILGNYLNCYIAHATAHDIRYNSTSGGMVTTILLHALETNLIDGALVTRMNPSRPLEPQPFIARTREEIISAAGSKYCPAPANIALKEILKAEAGKRFAVVGLPCHIHGVRKAEMMNKKLQERIPLHLGLVCSHVNTFHLTDLLLRRQGIHPEQVTQMNFRGRGWRTAAIRTREGNEIILPLHSFLALHMRWFFILERCTFCPDAMAELADISFGDAWLPELKSETIGHSMVISRTQVCENMLRSLESKGEVNTERMSAAKTVRGQIGVLYSKKKVMGARIRLFHRNAPRTVSYLPPGPIDYLTAVYQHANASLPTSRLFVRRVLKHIPEPILSLYGMPQMLACRIQMRRVMRQRYPSS
jgi:coenzyme F420 hydrogenase subunit beta